MAYRSISCTAVLLGIMLAAVPGTRAAQPLRVPSDRIDRAAETAPGIRTDQHSARKLRAWKQIEAIVLAKDAADRPSHPKLHRLWQWVEASGHVVQIELPDPKARCDHQAGKFMVEESDTDGRKHLAVIRLCLPVIDRASVRKIIWGADGFVRFEGLGKEERYAEILGHGLAHAVWILADRSHQSLKEDLDRKVTEFNDLRRRAVRDVAWDDKSRRHLRRIESLTTEIERPADVAEAEIWKELLGSRKR